MGICGNCAIRRMGCPTGQSPIQRFIGSLPLQKGKEAKICIESFYEQRNLFLDNSLWMNKKWRLPFLWIFSITRCTIRMQFGRTILAQLRPHQAGIQQKCKWEGIYVWSVCRTFVFSPKDGVLISCNCTYVYIICLP